MAKSKRKTPPCCIPASKEDVRRARGEGVTYGCRIAIAMMLTVLKDKKGVSNEDLVRIWKETEELSDSVKKRYVSMEDLVDVLREEYGIELWKKE